MKIKNAEILCVGTELLLGEVINTNVAYLGKALARLGISVYHTSVVGDNQARLREAVTAALKNADLLILSGGLGPTYDDLTKETVAEVLGLPMVRDEAILREIEEYFASSGRIMPPNNAKQADIPLGAIALKNRTGTAPGIFVEHNNKVVVLLPGPPFELCPMFDEFVFPRLRDMSDKILISHNIHIMGMGESEVEMHLLDLMKTSVNPSLAPYAKEGEMRLRVGALASSEADGEAMCQEMIKKVKASPVGEYIYALDAEYIEKLVVEKLKEKKSTLSVAESCTGGYLGKRITDIAGASNVFAGGFITYSNKAKIDLLGVNPKTLELHSAVSSEVAIEMAVGARERLDTDIAVSITGEAGPNPDPTTNKDVGTVFIGVATRDTSYSVKLTVSRQRDREYIRKVATSRAMREIVKILA
ncbi:MAG: competence/damage-inducible protein A [Clostridia bacterium]|nr:competence/damage-inducible protein A [Clostridia bacterium]